MMNPKTIATANIIFKLFFYDSKAATKQCDTLISSKGGAVKFTSLDP